MFLQNKPEVLHKVLSSAQPEFAKLCASAFTELEKKKSTETHENKLNENPHQETGLLIKYGSDVDHAIHDAGESVCMRMGIGIL